MSDVPELQGGQHQVLEDAGVAFDPAGQHLDLTKEEKRRTTALMMAIQGYKELIIREADYLREAADLARRGDGPKLQAATIDGIVDAAIKFDDFIAGKGRPSGEPEGHAAADVGGGER